MEKPFTKRRLALFFDGTWNIPENNTNVWRLADKHGITVVNETDLARMLETTDARFDPAALEILRDSRKLCPKCERELVRRTAGRGRGPGKQFWGCSGYPRCRFTMPMSDGHPRTETSAVR